MGRSRFVSSDHFQAATLLTTNSTGYSRILNLPSEAAKYAIKAQLRPKETAMKPTGSSSTFCDVVKREMTMMKNKSAVVRMVFCANLMMHKKGYFIQILLSVSMHTSLVINPRNQRRRCLRRLLYVWTASVLQKAPVLIPICP